MVGFRSATKVAWLYMERHFMKYLDRIQGILLDLG